ncbi:hypothetical protein KKG45_05665 [bacterium]|nr:hypothetical protein [bacterium]MBU1072716.1 hypothetical protein [bacterium]MBU1676580.1 hypothetical protein [bacterium]
MRDTWKSRLALIVGLVWTSAVMAQTIATGDPTGARVEQRPDPALAAWNAAPERPEPGGRPGPKQEAADEDLMAPGDLSEGGGSRWQGDVLVTDPTFDEVEPAMCKTPDGTLFIAVEQYGAYDGWIRIYRSTNGGLTWAWLVSYKSGNESRNPAITYANRTNGETWLFLAYEATMSDTTKRIVVVRVDPNNTGNWTSVTAASGITGTPDIHPRICTDNPIYDVFYVYVTYSVYAVDYYATMFTRSLDYGLTYSAPVDITGGSDSSTFASRPDIAYGTAGLFVAFEKPGWTGSAWKTEVWASRSTNYGGSWNAPVQLTTAEDGTWHPSVAAAIGVSTVMVAYTGSVVSQTDIYCVYSTDGGTSFGAESPLPRTFDNEKSVALSVSDSGGRYHAAFWRAYDIEYTYTDATSPLPWAPTTLVNEANWASSVYSRPAICVNPTRSLEEEACVAWADYRGSFYDVYFDTGFLSAPPAIQTVTDVPADQGLQVRLDWDASLYDDPGAPTPIVGYGIYRWAGVKNRAAVKTPDGRILGWDYLLTVPARGDYGYQYVAPTLADSTATGIHWSVFFVSAMTADPDIYFDSAPDSGYSIDNIVPPPPASFAVEYGPQNHLSWTASDAPDLAWYDVYRGDDPDFEPTVDSRVAQIKATSWIDSGGTWGVYYKVASVDDAGNVSEAVPNDAATGSSDTPPARTRLVGCFPNPFNPQTTIRYDLPHAARVHLGVYDVAGRMVRTLSSGEEIPAGRREVVWNGRDDAGRAVSTGVYFCRLEAGDYSATIRVALVK